MEHVLRLLLLHFGFDAKIHKGENGRPGCECLHLPRGADGCEWVGACRGDNHRALKAKRKKNADARGTREKQGHQSLGAKAFPDMEGLEERGKCLSITLTIKQLMLSGRHAEKVL